MRHTKEMMEKYKDRLKKIIATKIQTAMIYPLSQFEMMAGQMWGHGKSEDSLTDEERIWRAKWNECRNNILNNGNQQKRNAYAELDMHDVVWNGYKTVFLPVNKEQVNKE